MSLVSHDGVRAPGEPTSADLTARVARERVRRQLFGDMGGAPSIGRFLVLERIGAGGMGTVFGAYDPHLDRRVALKLLAPGPEQADDRGHARLLREARLMARLAHPNIVAVHEVGVHEGSVYVAMEFVRGRTFAEWLEQEDPPWPEVVERFVMAGRGLAAAHRQGVLHRDFKPSNVMIDDDGRVRVLDFGLAATLGDAPGTQPSFTPSLDDRGPSSPGSLTRTGAVLGTPLYLAPESLLGAPADPARDQYAFCVSLWQALYGAHPFARSTPMAFYTAITEGERPRAPSSARASRVPSWLRAVVERGLAHDPAARWPSMEALLEALSGDPTLARRRWAWRGIAALAVVGATLGAYRLGAPATSEPCALGHEALGGAWDPDRGEHMETVLRRHALPFADAVAPRVVAELDAYAERWLSGARALCEATTASRGLAPATEERSAACLEHRRRSLQALVEVLSTAEAGAVQHAVAAVESLPAPEPCTEPGRLADAEAPPPLELAPQVRRIEVELVELEARLATGATQGLRPRAQQAHQEAGALGHPPLLARATLILGHVQLAEGEYPLAEATLEDAFLRARATRVDDVARRAAGSLARMLGVTIKRPDDALLWAKQACAEAERTEDARARASCLADLAEVQVARRELDAAIEGYREALAIHAEHDGSERSEVGLVLNRLGSALSKVQRLDEAVAVLERALALNDRVLGPAHLQTATSRAYLGVALDFAGESERARQQLQQALELMTAAVGQDHPDVAVTHQNLARSLAAVGRAEEALVHVDAARIVWERVLGPQHPNVGTLRFNQGIALLDLSRAAEAAEQFSRAYAILAEGPEAVRVHACAALVGWATADRELGHHQAALAHAEQGLGQCEALAAGPELEAPARFEVAQALVALGREHERALALAQRARRELAELGPGHADVLALVDRWLDEHDAAAP